MSRLPDEQTIQQLQSGIAGLRHGLSQYTKHWEQEKAAVQKESDRLEADERAFANERAFMSVYSSAVQHDIVDLNVGGRPFTTTRATLCAEKDTLLAAMFSGGADASLPRDKNGAAFLDFDPDMFALLLNHLRTLQLTRTGNPLAPEYAQQVATAKPPALPSVPAEKRTVWDSMLERLAFKKTSAAGVQAASAAAASGAASGSADSLSVFLPEHSHRDHVFSEGGRRVTLRTDEDSWTQAVVSASIGKGETRTWRLRVVQGSHGDGLYFGFIRESDMASMAGKFSFSQFAGFTTDGRFCYPGRAVWDHKSRLPTPIRDGDIIELHYDGESGRTARVQLRDRSEVKVKLPEEWDRLRMCVGIEYTGQGVEILSVE